MGIRESINVEWLQKKGPTEGLVWPADSRMYWWKRRTGLKWILPCKEFPFQLSKAFDLNKYTDKMQVLGIRIPGTYFGRMQRRMNGIVLNWCDGIFGHSPLLTLCNWKPKCHLDENFSLSPVDPKASRRNGLGARTTYYIRKTVICQKCHKYAKLCESWQKWLDYADYSKICRVDKSLDKNCKMFTLYTLLYCFIHEFSLRLIAVIAPKSSQNGQEIYNEYIYSIIRSYDKQYSRGSRSGSGRSIA